jgi:hypothetical protein
LQYNNNNKLNKKTKKRDKRSQRNHFYIIWKYFQS